MRYEGLTLRTLLRTQMNMKTASSTELRANLSTMMDRVNENHEPLIVTRSKGRPTVMVSLEDYAAMEETLYLLSSPKNAKRLHAAIEAFDNGHGVEHSLAE